MQIHELNNFTGELGASSFLAVDNGIDTGRLSITNLKDYVTPEMFGAKGDGVTDDTVAIQAALNSGNKTVLFFKSYKVSNTLNVGSNTNLIGFKSSLITTALDIDVLKFLNCSFVSICGLNIEKPCGSNYHIVCSGYHHTIDGCNLMGNISSENQYVSGIHFIKPTSLSVEGYEFAAKNNHVSVGQIVVDGGTDGYLIDNVVWSATVGITPNCYAIEVKENSFDIKGNQIVPGKLGGILLQGDPGACLFSVVDNYFDGSHNSVLSGALLVVKDCDQNTLISNNKFYNCYKNAITIDNSPYSLITSNLFINNNRSSEADANDVVFINNQYGARAIITSNQFANYHTTPKDVFNASTTSTIVFKNNNIIGAGYIENDCYMRSNGVVSESNMRNGKVYAKAIGTVLPINDLWGIVMDNSGLLNNVSISKVYVNDVDKTSEYSLINYWGIYCACKGDAGYLNNAITVIYAHGV